MATWTAAAKRYDNMAYNRSGRSGLDLPALSLGLWHNFGGVDKAKKAKAMVRRAFDLGITHFDLANNYGPPPGSAEDTFGRILATDLIAHRDKLIISTKAGWEMWPGPYGDYGSSRIRDHGYTFASKSPPFAGMCFSDPWGSVLWRPLLANF